jgi:hypothetical protein
MADDDDAAKLRLRAEACRRLADLEENSRRKALWIERGDEWERLAEKAAKQERKTPRV